MFRNKQACRNVQDRRLPGAGPADKTDDAELAMEFYSALVNLGGAGPDLPGREEAEHYLSTATSEDR